jgi:hypothetical protein
MGRRHLAVNDAVQTRALRAQAVAGTIPRYIVRCGLEASGKVAVWDCLAGWICSRHSRLALAEKRAAELNRKVSRCFAYPCPGCSKCDPLRFDPQDARFG